MASTELITIEQVEDVLLHGGEVPIVDSDQIQADLVERILKAGSMEEAFGEFSAPSVEDIENKVVEVHGIAWVKSGFDEGPGIYALLKLVVVETGEQLTRSMGGRTTMARFVYAMRTDAMPIKGMFVYEASAQKNGRRYLTFKLAPRAAK